MLAGRALAAVEAAHPGLPGTWCVLAAELAEAAGNTAGPARCCWRRVGVTWPWARWPAPSTR